jgi:hypothetical protein
MNKIIAVGVISILVVTAVTLIGFGYLQDKNNQLDPEPSLSPTPTPTPTPTPAPTPTPSTSEKSTEPASIPEPSVPEFTVEYVDNSYYVPPTYGVDEYSGETVQIGGGFTVTNKSIELTIKYQPFTRYCFKDENGTHAVDLSYKIGYKGHFGEDWYYTTETAFDSGYDTVVLFWLECGGSRPSIFLGPLSAGDKVDFQVQARIGYRNYVRLPSHVMDPGVYEYIGETSEWSNTQTIKIP